jgi:hypothetical protein
MPAELGLWRIWASPELTYCSEILQKQRAPIKISSSSGKTPTPTSHPEASESRVCETAVALALL